jgi:glycine/D-amino acid oxidase-like deaminating enzyme
VIRARRRVTSAAAHPALAEARPAVFWTDRPDAPEPDPPLVGPSRADLAIVGGGFTGLWAALLAREADPAADIVALEADRIAAGASGRNGGFVAASLTHGLAHGLAMWPGEIETLLRLGRENLAAIEGFVATRGLDVDLRTAGKSTVAVQAHHVADLAAAHRLYVEHGEDATLLDADAMRADVASPTYLGGLRIRSGYALVDPARLSWSLAQVARAAGVRIHEGSAVTGLERTRTGVALVTRQGRVEARRAIVATSAFPPPLRRLRHWVLPVYDHVLMTEPMSASQRAAVGWPEAQGITDAGNRFHYYRLTSDDRILWGGYDAIYHFGNRVDPSLEQRDASHATLARHFFETFPQLEGLRFSHRWAGAIDSTSRFTPLFGTAFGGRVAYALGYTGLGVGSSRFGAHVALDLVHRRRTDRTALGMVRQRPFPFPPEPLRWLAVRVTQAELARQDASGGRRGLWLRLLDRLGMGFAS